MLDFPKIDLNATSAALDEMGAALKSIAAPFIQLDHHPFVAVASPELKAFLQQIKNAATEIDACKSCVRSMASSAGDAIQGDDRVIVESSLAGHLDS